MKYKMYIRIYPDRNFTLCITLSIPNLFAIKDESRKKLFILLLIIVIYFVI